MMIRGIPVGLLPTSHPPRASSPHPPATCFARPDGAASPRQRMAAATSAANGPAARRTPAMRDGRRSRGGAGRGTVSGCAPDPGRKTGPVCNDRGVRVPRVRPAAFRESAGEGRMNEVDGLDPTRASRTPAASGEMRADAVRASAVPSCPSVLHGGLASPARAATGGVLHKDSATTPSTISRRRARPPLDRSRGTGHPALRPLAVAVPLRRLARPARALSVSGLEPRVICKDDSGDSGRSRSRRRCAVPKPVHTFAMPHSTAGGAR